MRMTCRLLLIGLLALTPAFAQRGGGGRRGSDSDTGAPFVASTNRIDVIEKMFSLTKEQKKAVKLTLDNAQKEAAPVRVQLIKAHLAIGGAIQAGKSQAEVDQLAGAQAVLRVRMSEIEFKAFAKIYENLNVTQQTNSPALFRMMKGIFLEKNWNAMQ
jgi:hypothetical protein